MILTAHALTFPAGSTAVALNAVVVLAVTDVPIANDVDAMVLSAAIVPEQLFVLYNRTVTLASEVVPFTVGVVLLFDGDAGVVPVSVGRVGATLSWV